MGAVMGGLEALRRLHPFPSVRPEVPSSECGWFLECCREVLKGFSGNHNTTVLELGSWCGLSTRYLAQWNPCAAIVAIDTWEGGPDHVGDPKYQDLLPVLWETFVTTSWHLRGQLVPVRATTRDGLRCLQELGVVPDLVYIDASHEVEDVRQDVGDVLDFFPTAQVVGDDWLWGSVRTGVYKALHPRELLGRLRSSENCWWLEKVPCQEP